MSHWSEFDYAIINDDLDRAVADLEAVLAGQGESCSTASASVRDTVLNILP